MSDTPQGPGWWQASDGKYYPPEQTPGAGAGGAAAGGPTPGSSGNLSIDIGQAFSYGWTKFQANVGQLIIATLIGFAIASVLAIVGYFAVFATLLTGDPAECRTTSNGGIVCTEGSSPSFILFLLGLGLLMGLVFLGQFIFEMLMVRAGLLVTNGEEPEPGRVLSADRVGPYLVAALIMTALTAVGFMLCILPGIAVLIFGRFFGYYILDKGLAPVEAIKASFELVKNNVGSILLFLIAAYAINMVGSFICYVGLLVTMPLTAIATAYVYRQAEGQPIAP